MAEGTQIMMLSISDIEIAVRRVHNFVTDRNKIALLISKFELPTKLVSFFCDGSKLMILFVLEFHLKLAMKNLFSCLEFTRNIVGDAFHCI